MGIYIYTQCVWYPPVMWTLVYNPHQLVRYIYHKSKVRLIVVINQLSYLWGTTMWEMEPEIEHGCFFRLVFCVFMFLLAVWCNSHAEWNSWGIGIGERASNNWVLDKDDVDSSKWSFCWGTRVHSGPHQRKGGSSDRNGDSIKICFFNFKQRWSLTIEHKSSTIWE